MNKYILFFFFLVSSSLFHAQVQDSLDTDDEYVEEYTETGHYNNMYPADSVLLSRPQSENTVYPKKFKDSITTRYKGKEYDYNTHQPKESFLDKLMRKVDAIIRAIFGNVNPSGTVGFATIIFRIFVIVVIGFLLYFLINFIIGKNGNLFFGKKNKKVSIVGEELVENIHEINFPENILKFESNKEFRSAIRYQFLYILKKMSDKKLISWNTEKTNRDYINELKVPQQKSEFSELAHIFDYVWYGEFSLDEKTYQEFKSRFQSFKP
ncbi:MAG: DUF4129 domain-containing protein [Chryseobacterium sp.]|nr:DUF4129 domain-containing protein [Candidatus Chryseobacterium enterohippi]